MDGAAFFHREYRYGIRDIAKFRSDLASSQAVRYTKVAYSSSPGDEPRRGSHRRDGASLFDNANVDIVPAIINSSSGDSIGGYGGDADQRKHESQREESDNRRHFPCRTSQ